MSIRALAANALAFMKGQRRSKDLAYGSAPYQRLDVYAPVCATCGPARVPSPARAGALPVIVFFYGGGWRSGSKNVYRFAAEPFTSKGYLVVVPDYAKYPAHCYPTFLEDAASAVGWVYKNIHTFGGDNRRIFLAGHSAGAHMGAMLTTNPSYLQVHGVPRHAILGFAGLAGPYDFVPKEELHVKLFSAAGDDGRAGMPATYIDGTQPPMLLLYGLADNTVKVSNLQSVQEKVKCCGGQLECKLYEGIDHIGILSALSLPLRSKAPVAADMLEFFGELLGTPSVTGGASSSSHEQSGCPG